MTDDDLKSLALDFRDQMVGIDLLRAVFQAGAASRDAEVVSLTNQRDYEYARAENAEHDRLLVKIAPEDAEIAELVGVLGNVTTHLVAAHSLLSRGGKKAAASDTIFKIMLQDYEKSFEAGRKALAKLRNL